METSKLKALRSVINENLRVQHGGAQPVPYIDPANVLSDVCARQNHVIFGRRGCGKTLLLHHSVIHLPTNIKPVYLNCEDFKKHSFPNVLIEILDALFAELEKNLNGWFGRKKRSREIIKGIRDQFKTLRDREDKRNKDIREAESSESRDSAAIGISLPIPPARIELGQELSETRKYEIEKRYKINEDKIRELDLWLPKLKQQVREFFNLSVSVQAVFLQIDDFYHLPRADQPFIMDYVHRLCKDLPLFFKVATLRHASTLYSDRFGQPIGAQERHDYQPINVDFSLAEFRTTVQQNGNILYEFGRLSHLTSVEIDDLFKGEGFKRLILAGGGVPRDCLSLFLEILQSVQPPMGDGRIGKDDVRILSRSVFERRIEELKQDSEGQEQDILLKGIYVIRQFCIEKKTNIVLVPEALLQRNDKIRNLLHRILDYRIVHSAGSALTHKSQPGTYHVFAVDIGCYAQMRILQNRFTEIDLSDPDAKEKMRSAPILDEKLFENFWSNAPQNSEEAMKTQDQS
jgi:hypothetical protein